MTDKVQNIKIKFISDPDGIDDARKHLALLNDEELELLQSMKKVDDQSKKTNKTVSDTSDAASKNVKGLGGQVDSVSTKFSSLKNVVSSGFSVDSIRQLATTMTGAGASTDKASGSFRIFNLVLKANIIGIIITALAALVAYFKSTEEGGDKLTKALGILNAVFVEVKRVLTPIAETFISLFQILAGLIQLIFDFEGGMKNIQEGAEGVSQGISDTADAVSDFSDNVSEATKRTAELEDALDALEEAVIRNAIANAGLELTVDSLIRQSKNRTKSEQERIGLLEKANEIESKIAKSNEEAAAKALELELEQFKLKEINNKLIQQEAGVLQWNIQLYKLGSISVDELSEAQQRFAKNIPVTGQATTESLNAIKDKVLNLKGAIEGSLATVERNQNRIDLLREQDAAARKKAADDAAKARKELFDGLLKQIDLEQKLAERRAVLEGKSQSSIILIDETFNQKRLDLFERFGKEKTNEYASLLLTQEELDKKYTDTVLKEEEDRAKKLKELHDKTIASEIADADLELKQRQLQRDQAASKEIQSLRDQYKSGLITRQQYEMQLAQITSNAQRNSLKDEIEVLEDRLNIEMLSAAQRADIEKQLNDKKKSLYDLDFKDFEDNENAKLKLAQDKKKQREQIEQETFKIVSDLSNGLFAINKQNNDNELTSLQQKQAAELQAVGDNKQAQSIINKKFLQKENDIKTRQAKADKDQALFNIALSTAQAVIKQLATTPLPFGAPLVALVAASGALQFALAAAKPLPKFKKGTKSVPGRDTGEDTIMAMIRPGEAIIPTEKNKQFAPLIAGIIDGTLDPKMFNDMALNYSMLSKSFIGGYSGGSSDPRMFDELRSINKTLASLPVAHVNIDKKGIHTLIRSNQSETEFVNNYFRN